MSALFARLRQNSHIYIYIYIYIWRIFERPDARDPCDTISDKDVFGKYWKYIVILVVSHMGLVWGFNSYGETLRKTPIITGVTS